jgi:hypothetical protein
MKKSQMRKTFKMHQPRISHMGLLKPEYAQLSNFSHLNQALVRNPRFG